MQSSRATITAIFAKTQLAAQDAKAVRELGAALQEARKYTTENPEKTAGFLAKYAQLPLATVRSITRATWPATFDVNSMQPALDNAFKYNTLGKPLKASAMVAKGTS